MNRVRTRERLYFVDGFAGGNPEHQLKVRVLCSRLYNALFMHNMLIRPAEVELSDFGEPDFVIYNAGAFPANCETSHMTSRTRVNLSFEDWKLVSPGTRSS